MYYHSETRQCFELYRRGPCPSGNMINFLCGKNNIPISIFFPGHILSFDYSTFTPQCRCKDGYYLHGDGNCYQLNTAGEKSQFYLIQIDKYLQKFYCHKSNLVQSNNLIWNNLFK